MQVCLLSNSSVGTVQNCQFLLCCIFKGILGSRNDYLLPASFVPNFIEYRGLLIAFSYFFFLHSEWCYTNDVLNFCRKSEILLSKHCCEHWEKQMLSYVENLSLIIHVMKFFLISWHDCLIPLLKDATLILVGFASACHFKCVFDETPYLMKAYWTIKNNLHLRERMNWILNPL